MIICDITHQTEIAGSATIELRRDGQEPVTLRLDLSPEALSAIEAGDWVALGQLAADAAPLTRSNKSPKRARTNAGRAREVHVAAAQPDVEAKDSQPQQAAPSSQDKPPVEDYAQATHRSRRNGKQVVAAKPGAQEGTTGATSVTEDDATLVGSTGTSQIMGPYSTSALIVENDGSDEPTAAVDVGHDEESYDSDDQDVVVADLSTGYEPLPDPIPFDEDDPYDDHF